MKKIAETKNNTEKLTGYPHIDKPWMKYYDIELLEKELPQMTAYEYQRIANKDRGNLIAIRYYGKRINYSKFQENINRTAKGLTNIGVKEDDRIAILMPVIPETAYIMYGVNKLGAVCDFIDPRPDSNDIEVNSKKLLDTLKKEKANYIIAINQVYDGLIKPIEEELKEIGINTVITVSASESLPFIIKQLFKIKELRKSNKKSIDKNKTLNVIKWGNFIKNGKDVEEKECKYIKNKLALIVHTSGTTNAVPKPIPLTNDNMNTLVHQLFTAKVEYKPGVSVLQMLPYFAAYGSVNLAHFGFVSGAEMIQIPQFEVKDFGKILVDNKAQHAMGMPSWYLAMIKDERIKNVDLSYLETAVCGGDKLTNEEEQAINQFYKEHNSKCVVTKGIGMSEIGGCGTYAVNNYNDIGYLGIPLPNTTYMIVNPETKEPLNFENKEKIQGLAYVSTPAMTSGKLDGNEIVPHMKIDGKDYINTRDIIEMNTDGKIKFVDRESRMFTRYDGYKIYPSNLENIIKNNNIVENCCVVPYYDEKNFGYMPIAHITFKDNIDTIDEEKYIKKIVDENFIKNKDVSTRDIPSKFKIRSEIPLTKNSKMNYNMLINEKLTGNEVNVKINENNLSVSDIKNFKNIK